MNSAEFKSINRIQYYSKVQIINRNILIVLINFILYMFCLSFIFPFAWLLINSFKTRQEFALNIFSLPNKATLSNYIDIFRGKEAFTAFFNSLQNTTVAMVLIVLFSFVIAYFLSRYSFVGRNFIYGFFLIGMLVPIHALLIPVYIQFSKIGLTNHSFTLWIPYVTFNMPVAIYLYDSYIRSISRSIEEAAFVDGANINCIMYRIMFPICLPITGTVLILNFMNIWNEFSFALVLASQDIYRTVPIWLTTFQGQYTSNIPLRLTAMMLACLPIILAYLFFRDKMMEGMTTGAIKG